MACEHENFYAAVDVARLTDCDGRVSSFNADVKIRCADCGRQFQFLGLPAGVNLAGATTSIDGLEARMAICPQGEKRSVLDNIGLQFPAAVKH
ncbi:hypothetical protein RN629_01105 [Sphingomonadaceae bacterium jetA1]|jgi:hypothetical protein|uniref:hypothetical protein n=1 Tax=Facivitalis istanbulensis TaxID=3075838 RepID=UPI00349A1369